MFTPLNPEGFYPQLKNKRIAGQKQEMRSVRLGGDFMGFTRTSLFLIILIALLILLAGSVNAQTPAVTNPIRSSSLAGILVKLANFVVKLGIPVMTFFLIFAGLKFVTAQGNAQKLAEARRMFYWTIVGGVILLGASWITLAVINFARSLPD